MALRKHFTKICTSRRGCRRRLYADWLTLRNFLSLKFFLTLTLAQYRLRKSKYRYNQE